MIWAIVFLALVVVGVGVLVATGRLGGMAPEPIRDVYQPILPTGSLTAEDLHGLKLGVSAQGYSMSQVDDLVDRLADEIGERDRIIEELRPAAAPDSAEISPIADTSEALAPPAPGAIGNNEGVR